MCVQCSAHKQKKKQRHEETSKPKQIFCVLPGVCAVSGALLNFRYAFELRQYLFLFFLFIFNSPEVVSVFILFMLCRFFAVFVPLFALSSSSSISGSQAGIFAIYRMLSLLKSVRESKNGKKIMSGFSKAQRNTHAGEKKHGITFSRYLLNACTLSGCRFILPRSHSKATAIETKGCLRRANVHGMRQIHSRRLGHPSIFAGAYSGAEQTLRLTIRTNVDNPGRVDGMATRHQNHNVDDPFCFPI